MAKKALGIFKIIKLAGTSVEQWDVQQCIGRRPSLDMTKTSKLLVTLAKQERCRSRRYVGAGEVQEQESGKSRRGAGKVQEQERCRSRRGVGAGVVQEQERCRIRRGAGV